MSLRSALLICIVVATLFACFDARRFRDPECAQDFANFVAKYNKKYSSHEEYLRRQRIFCHNRNQIHSHNLMYEAKGTSFTKGINKFGDLTRKEFKDFVGAAMNYEPTTSTNIGDQKGSYALPNSWDWSSKGVVGPVQDQGQCGSGWAIGAVDAVASCHALQTGNYVPLSVQQVVDCSSSFGNQGCDGGFPSSVFQYIIANGGIDGAGCYPYVATDYNCNYNASCCASMLQNYANVTSGNENALQQAVYKTPVMATIDASQLQFYEGGVFSSSSCSSTQLDMSVLVTGWGVMSNQPYWIIQLSWGTDFGLNGFVYLARNDNNMCGIATAASYPIGCPNCKTSL